MTNLIEQLGGYERASSIAKCKSGIVHPTEQLLAALLEYRRQHNIFDVGDKVVKTNDKLRFSYIRFVISTTPSGGACLDYQGFGYKYPSVRHATDKEIAQGYRDE